MAQTKAYPLVDWVRLAAKCLGIKPKLVNIPDKVLQAADFKFVEPFTDNAVTVDISKAEAQLGFQPTPIESWTEITCNWYQESEFEDDAPGYADRDKEVKLAENYGA